MKFRYEKECEGWTSYIRLSYFNHNQPSLGFCINKIYTPQAIRNRGFARALLTQVCNDADTGCHDLWLTVAPEADTDFSRLDDFYRSMGFVCLRGLSHRRYKQHTSI